MILRHVPVCCQNFLSIVKYLCGFKRKTRTDPMNRLFQTVDWANNTSIYEVNVRQYTSEGTFNAFAKELPRLKDMGVQTIWFMPITPISLLNRKGTLGSYYACSDYK